MPKSFRTVWLIPSGASLLLVQAVNAAVSLNFTNGGTQPALTSVAAGGTFSFSVKMTESSPSDQISGVDYQIHASTNGVFEFLSRNSQVTGSQFTYDNGSSDSSLTTQVLNPNNGTDLGTSTATGLAVSGPNTYEISDFSFEVLPGTPKGVYTLSFINADTSGPPPGYANGNFNSLGTYTVFVPSLPLLGDANLDGQVDGSDYSLIDNGFLGHLTGYNNGDFNLDGIINGSDYTLIDNAFNLQNGALAAQLADPLATSTAQPSQSTSVVPEPTVLVLASVLLPTILRRRRSS